eukprot:6182760-Pyramimonas_sp.AAC.1
MRQSNMIATEQHVAEAQARGEHSGWGGRMIGRRHDIPVTAPADRDYDGDITMHPSDGRSSAQASSSSASASGVSFGHHPSQPL